MTNKSDKKIILKTPTQILRKRLRLIGLDDGFDVPDKLKEIKKINF
jgi:hypothetical protein